MHFINTEISGTNPERMALDTLIEISNEPAEIDHNILKTEEGEGLEEEGNTNKCKTARNGFVKSAKLLKTK